MSLYPLFSHNQSPLSYDGYDALVSSLLGGEVATLTSYGIVGTDKHAKDVDDGYSVTGLNTVRPIVTTTLAGTENGSFLFLTDDGTTNYGTLFGTVVGANTGTTVTGGTALGPSTMTGSGKVTLWQQPGVYGVSLDALNTASITAATSLTVGTVLAYTTAGKITLRDGTAANTTSCTKIGRFIEFATSGSLVNTPSSLSRVGISGGMKTFKYMVLAWNPDTSV